MEDPRAHEVWSYQERARTATAKLVRIEVACALCHYVHHFAQAELLHEEGAVSDEGLKAVKRHFQMINGCSPGDFDLHYSEALKVWRARSLKRWAVDYGAYAEAVQEAIAFRERWRARLCK